MSYEWTARSAYWTPFGLWDAAERLLDMGERRKASSSLEDARVRQLKRTELARRVESAQCLRSPHSLTKLAGAPIDSYCLVDGAERLLDALRAMGRRGAATGRPSGYRTPRSGYCLGDAAERLLDARKRAIGYGKGDKAIFSDEL